MEVDKSIENLVQLLEKSSISNTELINALDGISFKNIPDSGRSTGLTKTETVSTASPKNLSPKPKNKDSVRKFDEFIERVSEFENVKTRKRRETAEFLKSEENFKCTFSPSITQNSLGRATFPNFHEKVEERLLKLQKQKNLSRTVKNIEKELNEEKEISENCTFMPYITSVSGKSKYWKKAVENKKINLDSECTFNPKINKKSKNIQPRYNNPTKSLKINENSPKTDPKGRTTPQFHLRKFLERQESYDNYKKRNSVILSQTLQNIGSPKIDPISTKLALKYGKFEKRLEYFENKRTSKIVEDPAENQTFKPKINRANSVKIANVSLHFKCKEEIENNDDLLNSTFTPSLYKSKEFNNIESKLQLNNDIENYIKRVENDRKTKEIQNKNEKIKNEAEKLLECTHKPKLAKIPYWIEVKQKLNSMRESKSNSEKKSIRNFQI